MTNYTSLLQSENVRHLPRRRLDKSPRAGLVDSLHCLYRTVHGRLGCFYCERPADAHVARPAFHSKRWCSMDGQRVRTDLRGVLVVGRTSLALLRTAKFLHT